MTWRRLLCVGEAMIELAPLGGARYQRGFAGDTFNTAWHMAQVLGGQAEVGFVTTVGEDTISDAFVKELASDGLLADVVSRTADRTMGLYLIELDGVERSFHYWRSVSAARAIADDPAQLRQSLSGADLIHLSGITVAILTPAARETLLEALGAARAEGAQISFDPNYRPALWNGVQEVRDVLTGFMASADILLPSFDDEQNVWEDASPEATLGRLEALCTGEIIVKDGAGPVCASIGGDRSVHPTRKSEDVRDTTGAGDAFNAGYLAARALGIETRGAVQAAQELAALVLQYPGARADNRVLGPFLLGLQ